MDSLLRQYETWECGSDGYPFAWHGRSSHPEESEIARYDLPAIKDEIRILAGHRCLRCGHPYRAGDPAISERGEWSPCDEHCTHVGPGRWETKDGVCVQASLPAVPGSALLLQDKDIVKVEAHWRILTVHHLDEDKGNCRWWNLAALCQRCHLRMQRAVVMDRVYSFEHSEWFKPYAAGFYAFKYLRPMIGEAEYLDMGKGLQDLYEAMHEDESPTPTHDRCFRRAEDRELTRDEVMSLLDELLALEHRFTQEAIF